MLPNLTDQFIADSYKGVLHTANIPVSEANLPPVYDGLGNKSSLRLGSEGNGAAFSGSLSADNFSMKGYATIIDYLYPIESIYITAANVNPQTRFINTTWEMVSIGRFLAGVGLGDDGTTTKNINAGENSGKFSAKLTTSNLPSHSHSGVTATMGPGGEVMSAGNPTLLDARRSKVHEDDGHTSNEDTTKTLRLDGQVFLDSVGGNQPFEISPPSFGVYVWKRTS